MDCNFQHEDIDRLHGVKPVPIDELPKFCTCGAALSYAVEVAFISLPQTSRALYDESGNVVLIIEPMEG
jgi:hypothetical protein